MAVVDVLIPQMGEGLHEVIVLSFNKQPGDPIKRDELLYSMETDKAVMEVESPYDGTLREWLVEEGTVLEIGAPVARIETSVEAGAPAGAGARTSTEASPQTSPARSDIIVPPRTRAYCRELGITDEEMQQISAPSGKMMPADVDAYLKAKTVAKNHSIGDVEARPYSERPLSTYQKTFIYRLTRSANTVVPATAKRAIPWGTLRKFAETIRTGGSPIKPSTFQTFAFCVAQAVKEHPKFRSALIGEATLRQYDHVNVGIAVALSDGDLITAVVPEADTLDFTAFIRTAQERIQLARNGEDQADESTQLLLTYMGAYEIVDAVPVLVAPAAAVLFIGSSYEQNGEQLANLALTFDHRLIQGIEAAKFLQTIAGKVTSIEQEAGNTKG